MLVTICRSSTQIVVRLCYGGYDFVMKMKMMVALKRGQVKLRLPESDFAGEKSSDSLEVLCSAIKLRLPESDVVAK